MSYSITLTNGNVLTSVPDGQLVSTYGGISLMGKKYPGFGTSLNTDLARMVEHFANSTPPSNPLVGQIWFDTVSDSIKFWDGNEFKSISVITASTTAPLNPINGDEWFDSVLQQLFVWNGSEWILIGPPGSEGIGKEGFIVAAPIPTANGNVTCLELYANNNLIAIVSSETILDPGLGGFGDIRPGINFVTVPTTGILESGIYNANEITIGNNDQLVMTIDAHQNAVFAVDGGNVMIATNGNALVSGESATLTGMVYFNHLQASTIEGVPGSNNQVLINTSGNLGATPSLTLDSTGLNVEVAHNLNVSGKVLAAEGAGTTGGYSFTADGGQDTGMFSSADGVLSFYTNGTQSFGISGGNSTVAFAGAISVNGGAGVAGSETVGGTLGVNGATTLYSSLDVKGTSDLESTLDVTGATTLHSSLDTKGTALLEQTLDVDGATTLHSSLDVKGTSDLESTLDVTGATTLHSSLVVDGTANLASTLGVSGATTINNTLLVSGAATLEGTLGVTGQTTINSGTSGAFTLPTNQGTLGAALLSNGSGNTMWGSANIASWGNNSLTTNGYQVLPSGLIIQWCQGAPLNGSQNNTNFTTNFPIAFTNCLFASVSAYTTDGSDDVGEGVTFLGQGWNASSVTYRYWRESDHGGLNYIYPLIFAIGY